MSQEGQLPPFKSLGERLRIIRQKLHESAAEVSGAVEIDEPTLTRIEQGQERPAEDILMLLISHFGMHEEEAAGLWQLAGYEPPRDDDDTIDEHTMNHNKATILVMAVDPRVIYSDGVQVQANPNGVVVNFSQGNGSQHQLTTARIGMSRQQAKNVMLALQEALRHSEPH
jgi:transcriptional regulator with XRE-family HTH domain